MSLSAGCRLGPYEIVAPLGAGGMGEVYRARDTRLGRSVAVKVLPQSLAHDPERLQRFQSEARAVAALDHPNILGLYDIGDYDGAPFLVCELLEGQSLRERMSGGALGQRKAVEYASQIAQGLAAAHDKDIVHRDLKPDNIFVTNDGRVKILDFGLAKLRRENEAAATATQDGTAVDAHRTSPGVVLGTAGYMSPEQVRGKPVDARTDIFSFGAVLYEMLSGRRAFQGDSSVETMNAILKDEPPDLTTTGLHVSPGIERVVRRCLEKNPDERFQSAHDLAFSIEALAHSTTTAAVVAPPRRSWKPWASVILALLVGIAAGAFFLARTSAPQRTEYFAIPVANEVSHFAISRDGKMLAFVSIDNETGQRMLYVQAIGSNTAALLPGTENALFPFWSPNDQYIGFFANRKLMKIAVAGGPPQALAPVATPRGGSWSPKNVIIFSAQGGGPLLRVNADGSGLGPLTAKMMAPNESSHRWPQFLPDGNHFIFWAGNFSRTGNQNGIWISSLDGEPKRFVQATSSNASYVDPGELVYVGAKGQVLMQDFDLKTGKTHGEAHVIAQGAAYDSSFYWGAFAVSRNGILVWNTSSAASQSQLTWVDRTGKELGTVGPAGLIFNPAISPDGQRVAADVDDVSAGNVDVWIRDLAHGTATRFTFSPAEDATPVWSPDGREVAYRSESNIILKPANGLGPEHLWTAKTLPTDDNLANSWTPDGKSLIYTSASANGQERLMILNRDELSKAPLPSPEANPEERLRMLKRAEKTGHTLLSGPGSFANAQISADGKWMAYMSDESGVWEIYITSFPGLDGKWQVSQGGGTEPRWRHDGKELFYVNAKGILTAVPVSTDNGFSTGVAQPLFPLRARMAISTTDRFSYDVAADGKKFLINRYISPAYVKPLDIAIGITASTK